MSTQKSISKHWQADKKDILARATMWMDLEDMLNEKKPDTKTQIPCDFTHMWHLK